MLGQSLEVNSHDAGDRQILLNALGQPMRTWDSRNQRFSHTYDRITHMQGIKDSQWGLYPWWEAHGTDMIHPDDLLTVQRLNPGSKVFQMTVEDDEFIRLRYGSTEFRARPAIFKPVDATIHDIGKTVTLKDGRSGEVIGIMWHHKHNEPMYELRVEGKKKSKRYWNSDFVA